MTNEICELVSGERLCCSAFLCNERARRVRERVLCKNRGGGSKGEGRCGERRKIEERKREREVRDTEFFFYLSLLSSALSPSCRCVALTAEGLALPSLDFSLFLVFYLSPLPPAFFFLWFLIFFVLLEQVSLPRTKFW